MTTLAEKIVAIDRALSRVPHAFGGALALAYYAEPRATIDIDINLFVDAGAYNRVVSPLMRLGASTAPDTQSLVTRDGQARIFWDETPLDLFFQYDAFHEDAATATLVVPFASTTMRILSASHLVVCKTVFNRAKDWVDIDAMLAAETAIDVALVMRWVGRIAGDEDPRYARIATVLAA